MSKNLRIPKTIKLFINGQFPRTESGRTLPIPHHGSEQLYANACLGSRKDLRAAVEAAKKAYSGWNNRTAYNRSQILYRMAEMTEGKHGEFSTALQETLGMTAKAAEQSVDEVIATFIYYAGFADKFAQVTGAINPVAGPFHNFTAPDSVGVVGLISNEPFDFVKTVDQLCAIIVSGNTVVTVITAQGAALLAPLAEVFATSDLPAGVVNLISGHTEELYPHLGGHMEVHSISYQGENKKVAKELKDLAIENMKRVNLHTDKTKSLENILNFTEFKTVWHPVGL